MAYTILRTKKGDQVAFRGQCKHHPKEPVGVCSAQLSSSGTANHLDIINVDLTDEQGSDYNVVYDVSYTKWRTRVWADDKSSLESAVTYDTPNDTLDGLNGVLQFQDSDAVTEGSVAGINTTNVSVFKHINASGVVTATHFYGDGSNLTNVGGGSTDNIITSTASTFASIYSTGIITATSFVGDGSNLTGVISGIGINTASGNVGYGVTLLDFRGAGVSTITPPSAGISTINITGGGGGAGNPVVSGIFTGTDLVLTLDDSSTVTIDAVKAINGTEVTIDLPNWYQQYLSPGTGFSTAGNQVGSMTITAANNPFYYGTTLKKGEEYIWSHSNTSGSAQFIGIWNGSVTYTPSLAGHNDYWTRKLQIVETAVNDVGGNYGSVGFDLSSNYTITEGGTDLALRYDNSTSKLQLWDKTNDVWKLITTASVAEDGNPVTITVAGADSVPIPNWTKREHEWEIIAQLTEGAQTAWYGETQLHDSVLRKTRGLYKGQKMVLTTPGAWNNQYLGFDYTGITTGQTDVQAMNTGALQFSSAEKILEHIGFTINTLSDRYSSGTTTSAMGGGKISFRYHTDNKVDLYDEDNEEVLFTKNVDGDGNPIYLHHYNSTNVSWNYELMQNWSFEPFDQSWFVNPLITYHPNKLVTESDLSSYTDTRVDWGQQLYPGEELRWEHNASNNTNIGQRNALDSGWITRIEFTSSGIDVSDCEGFDIAGSDPDVDGDVMSLRYDYGDNKLKLYNLNTVGISTLITTSNDALDGNPITLSLSGGTATIPTSIVHRYYGWEYIHTPTAYPQTWKNWRLTRPSINNSIKNDTVVRSLRALIPGYRMRWISPASATNTRMGKWKSANASSGLTNVDTNDTYWDWGFRWNNEEKVKDLIGMTFNASNPNYDAATPYWEDPDKGVTQVQIRYNSDNSIDLYDFTNSAIIATVDSAGDGNPIYIDFGTGGNLSAITDDFLGGGDVGFGLTT